MKEKTPALVPDGMYHIYNRANGNEQLFISDDNYQYFLKKYRAYINPVAETFCYCLMPNHFHFLVRVRGYKSIEQKFKEERGLNLQGFQNLEGLISKQFSNFFNAYSKAFNKKYDRQGNLFMHTFKRKRVDDERYLYKLIHYIHYNPVESGLCQWPVEWKYSSFRALVSKKETTIKREEVIAWFDNKENFIHCHTHPPEFTGIEDM